MIMGMKVMQRQDFQIKLSNNPPQFLVGVQDDVETLKKIYPKYSHKIYKTGSPRADLWKPMFALSYWNVPSKIPKKPFLLISCNTGYSNNINSFGRIN